MVASLASPALVSGIIAIVVPACLAIRILVSSLACASGVVIGLIRRAAHRRSRARVPGHADWDVAAVALPRLGVSAAGAGSLGTSLEVAAEVLGARLA